MLPLSLVVLKKGDHFRVLLDLTSSPHPRELHHRQIRFYLNHFNSLHFCFPAVRSPDVF